MMSEVAVSPPPSVSATDDLVKLFLIGASGVGKSSLVQRFTDGKYSQQYAPSAAQLCVSREVRVANERFGLQLLDLPGLRPGQLPFPAEGLTETSVVVMVFDWTSEESFEVLEGFFTRLLAACAHGSVEPLFVLIGNKCDLDRAVPRQHVKKWCAAKRRMGFELLHTEASAKLGFRVCETFVRAAGMALKRHHRLLLSHSMRAPASRLPCVFTQPPERVHPSTVSALGRGYIALNRRMGRLQSMRRSSSNVAFGDILGDVEEERTLVKVIVAGTAGVGKTSIIERFSIAALEAMEERTDESEFCHVDVAVNGVPMTLQLWDISDDPRCYKDAHALVMVFDLTNRGSFAALDGYWKFFTRYAGVREDNQFPCVLVGNKCDLNLKRPIPQDQISAFCRKQSPSHPIPYVEVSAEQEINLDELFKVLSLAAYTSFAVGELPEDMFLPVLNVFRPTEERKSSAGGCQPCGGLSSFWQTLFRKESTSPTSRESSGPARRRSF